MFVSNFYRRESQPHRSPRGAGELGCWEILPSTWWSWLGPLGPLRVSRLFYGCDSPLAGSLQGSSYAQTQPHLGGPAQHPHPAFSLYSGLCHHLLHHLLDEFVGCSEVLRVGALQQAGQHLRTQRGVTVTAGPGPGVAFWLPISWLWDVNKLPKLSMKQWESTDTWWSGHRTTKTKVLPTAPSRNKFPTKQCITFYYHHWRTLLKGCTGNFNGSYPLGADWQRGGFPFYFTSSCTV